MEEHLRAYIVVPHNKDIAAAWAYATLSALRKGRPIPSSDAWIAATAIAHRLPLVTHNGRDFAGVEGLDLWVR